MLQAAVSVTFEVCALIFDVGALIFEVGWGGLVLLVGIFVVFGRIHRSVGDEVRYLMLPFSFGCVRCWLSDSN